MSKPATEARLAAAAKGFTQVIGRGNAHIITKDPSTGKCCYDGQVGGGWHYNGDQETDTAWEADSDQNYLKMVKAGYNLRARKLFNAGDLIQWTDPVSGQYIKFQPQNFALAKHNVEFVSSFHVLCGPADGIKTRIDNRPPINLFTLAQNVVK